MLSGALARIEEEERMTFLRRFAYIKSHTEPCFLFSLSFLSLPTPDMSSTSNSNDNSADSSSHSQPIPIENPHRRRSQSVSDSSSDSSSSPLTPTSPLFSLSPPRGIKRPSASAISPSTSPVLSYFLQQQQQQQKPPVATTATFPFRRGFGGAPTVFEGEHLIVGVPFRPPDMHR